MKEMELLAPGGDVDAAKAAILAGADAIYCGLDKYNARNRAENIQFDDLLGLIHLAHEHECQVFLTLNILILDAEIPEFVGLLNKLVNTKIDAVIVQDLGMMYLLKKHFPSLEVHASTQLTTHNQGQIEFLHHLGVSRGNLSRELNLSEITDLSRFGLKRNVLTEVFVHGSYCISFSGLCYMSSVQNGKSGNRGRCSQPCREKYETTSMQKEFPLNLKDNSAYFDVKDLYEAGVSTLKLEGRIKEFYYVSTVVNAWRKQLSRFYRKEALIDDKRELYKVFNRDFSNGYLKDNLTKDMFIDSPMTYSSIHHSSINNHVSFDEKAQGHKDLYAEKDLEREVIKKNIDGYSTKKSALKLFVSGEQGSRLQISMEYGNDRYSVSSNVSLAGKGQEALSREMLMKRLKSIDDTEYQLTELNLDALKGDVYISYKELTALKLEILRKINDGKELVPEITLPKISQQKEEVLSPSLCVLIDSEDDLALCENTLGKIYYQLPGDLTNSLEKFVELFKNNSELSPWFPAILIGDDFKAAVALLDRVKPKHIVSNNTGLGFAASERGIDWVAGPQLNIVNSYSLLCLKEHFNCKGAFISNELKKKQIQYIKKPKGFDLYFSIYHPIALMTTRQCLFYPVSGCEKHKMDKTCIKDCSKEGSITNLKGERSLIKKGKGDYHHVYNDHNYLNTAVSNDFPGFFSSYLIDLRNITTGSKVSANKAQLITEFSEHILATGGAGEKLHASISPTTFRQYKKGI